MITNQIGKRNLNDYQRSVMVLKLEELLKPVAKAQQIRKPESVLPISEKQIAPINTQKEIAKVAHVSHDTIAKVKVIEAKATPEQKQTAGDRPAAWM
jgi:hypothetical protein